MPHKAVVITGLWGILYAAQQLCLLNLDLKFIDCFYRIINRPSGKRHIG